MRRARITATGLGAVLTLTAAACSGSDHPAPSPAPPTSGTSSRPAGTTTPAPTRGGSLPTLPALPTDLAHDDPCAHADTAFTAASVYLGLAQLGRTDEAQRCVRGSGVDRATTAALTAAGVAAFYLPTGSTGGPTLRFRAASGGVTVTVGTAERDGAYGVVSVSRG